MKRNRLRHPGSTSVPPISITAPFLNAQYLAEPPLGFCGGREHVSPQKGIAIFGPRSLDLPRHPLTIGLGFIGTGQSIQSAQNWIDYTDVSMGLVHRDFRRALKAEAMNHRLPTQILLQRTSEAGPESKKVDHRSKCAWNFFTGMYFKCGGIPWSPRQLTPGTCYIGVSFFRSLGSESQKIRSSVAQAFDEHGDGIVLRGQDFLWDDEKHGNSPHLSESMANDLIAMVLRRYEAEMKQMPTRVVIHKSSRFWPDEKKGFEAALKQVRQFDLLAVNPNSQVRLLRAGQYPPLRGTSFQVGDTHYLYTTGFIPALKAYPHGHVPSPLQVADHFGDSSIETLLRELLTLTKMNWNSATFAGLMPITLRFSRLVGDIMREIPLTQNHEPLPQFRYYI